MRNGLATELRVGGLVKDLCVYDNSARKRTADLFKAEARRLCAQTRGAGGQVLHCNSAERDIQAINAGFVAMQDLTPSFVFGSTRFNHAEAPAPRPV
jgi:hypothetical protein